MRKVPSTKGGNYTFQKFQGKTKRPLNRKEHTTSMNSHRDMVLTFEK
jgi:hypothetical protein